MASSEGGGPKVSGGVSVSMSELNPHFVCLLCFGYFVDATTIIECMHTFCKSCIVNFLRTKRQCPRCETLLTKSRPCNSLRPDRVMQALVFKTVPGLFQAEMRRRIEFYQGHPHADYEQDVEDFQHYVFSPDDSVSLSIRYYNFSISTITCVILSRLYKHD
ncbi:polycomb complex protein BMI-1-like [Penaeus indicus]|uniref:polycomb complex protein BMI-1-like n=1 Tax=Penaeus indicus TaxID=29960 RepID=UPI00300CE795